MSRKRTKKSKSRSAKATPRKGALSPVQAGLKQRPGAGRLHIASEAPPIIVFNQDRSLRYTWIHNPHAGFDPGPYLGKTGLELLPTENPQRLTELKRRVMKTGTGAREVVNARVNGEVLFYDFTVDPLCGDAGEVIGVTCAFVDVTRHSETEEALRKSEARSRALLDALPDLMFRVNREGVFLDYKADTADLYYQSGNLIGKKNRNVTPAVFADLVEHYTDLTLDSGEMQTFEYQLPIPGRGLRDYEARMVKSGNEEVIIVVRDITERKEVEGALLEREARLKRAQKVAHMGFLDWNLVTNEIELSQQVIEMFGLDARKRWVTPEFVAHVCHPEDLEYVSSHLDMAVRGEKSYDIDHRIVRSDGVVIWVHAQAELSRNEQGKPSHLLGTVVDITERKITERINDKIIESSINALYIYDLQKEKNIFISPQYTGLTGYTIEDMKAMEGRFFRKLFHPDDQAEITQHMEQVTRAEDGKILEIEYRFKHANGEWKWYRSWDTVFDRDPRGNVRQFIGSFIDITERKRAEVASKRAETALRENEDRLRRITDNAPDIIYRYRIFPEPKFEFVSPAVKKVIGYTPEEHYADPQIGLRIVHPEDRSALIGLLEGKLPKKSHSPLRWIRKDGSVVWMEDSHTPIYDETGKLVAIEGVARDITERKEAEEKLRDRANRLKTFSQRLLTVQEKERRVIARDLHDQVGQTLTAVKLNLQAAQRTTDLQRIRANNKETVTMIEQVLNAVRTLSLELHPSILYDLGLVPAIRWLVEGRTREQPVQVTIDAKPFRKRLPLEIEITCFQILQEAFTNILRHADADHIGIAVKKIDNHVLMTIQDDGKGFIVDQAQQQGLRGRSLGLLSMQERASDAGGVFEISSARGKGTRVSLRIPVAFATEGSV